MDETLEGSASPYLPNFFGSISLVDDRPEHPARGGRIGHFLNNHVPAPSSQPDHASVNHQETPRQNNANVELKHSTSELPEHATGHFPELSFGLDAGKLDAQDKKERLSFSPK